MNVSDLKAAPYNPRKITEAQLNALDAAMKEFGDLGGIIRNRKTGNLVGGHQRVKLLDGCWTMTIRELERMDATGTVAVGYIDTPSGTWAYREVSWSEQKEKAANLAANKHGGDWSLPELKDLLVSLDDGSFDLSLTGFDEKELEFLIGKEAIAGALKSEDSADKLFEQINFVLSHEQAAIVRAALEKAFSSGPFTGTGNENKNGNALARIAQAYGRS